MEPEDPDDFPFIPLAGYGSFYLDALDDVAEDFDEDGNFDEEGDFNEEDFDNAPEDSPDSPNLSPFLR